MGRLTAALHVALLLLLGLDGAFHDEKALCVFIKLDGEKPVRVDGVVAELTSLSRGVGVESCHAEVAGGRAVYLTGEGCVTVGIERREVGWICILRRVVGEAGDGVGIDCQRTGGAVRKGDDLSII